jgi:CBS domain-containing protein
MGLNMTKKITQSTSRYPLVVKLPPTATVTTAAKMMADHNVGAIMIMNGKDLLGIFTERDLVKRVTARGQDPDRVALAEVMTPQPIVLESGQRVTQALQLMTSNKIRHLPLVEDGEVVGMLSARDLLSEIIDELRRDIDTKDAMIFGEFYGMAANKNLAA